MNISDLNYLDKIQEKNNLLIQKSKNFQQQCNEILKEFKKPNIFTFGDNEIYLTEEQSDVVYENLDKNILIIACAGSGKTTTITCRIKYLIDCGVDPDRIILTTFTRDACNAMKEKIDLLFGYRTNIWIGTIDSIAKKTLYTYGKDMVDTNISSVSEYGPKFLKFLQTHYNKDMFLDMHQYLFVDEFQDIDDTQFGIINEFYKHGIKIIAVGDDAQNIYGFRGSSIEHILNLDKKFDNIARHTLTKNYRSTPEIIKLANCSIEKNKFQYPKQMINSEKNQSINFIPFVEFFYNASQQNNFILDKILMFVKKNIPLDEIAVLSLSNESLFGLEELLTKNQINNSYLDSKSDIKTKIKENHVTLSTIHKAKGLEWSVVFMINLNDEIFQERKLHWILKKVEDYSM